MILRFCRLMLHMSYADLCERSTSAESRHLSSFYSSASQFEASQLMSSTSYNDYVHIPASWYNIMLSSVSRKVLNRTRDLCWYSRSDRRFFGTYRMLDLDQSPTSVKNMIYASQPTYKTKPWIKAASSWPFAFELPAIDIAWAQSCWKSLYV